MMMRRVLLQEAAHHQRNPCVQNMLHNVTSVAEACHRAYVHLHGHHEGSPIPYLLAGLAAMLALVAISLLILACSYWKLVGCVEQQAARAYANSTAGTLSHPPQNGTSNIAEDLLAPHDDLLQNSNKLVVIMAGHDKPTFLAQPVGVIDARCTVAACNVKV